MSTARAPGPTPAADLESNPRPVGAWTLPLPFHPDRDTQAAMRRALNKAWTGSETIPLGVTPPPGLVEATVTAMRGRTLTLKLELESDGRWIVSLTGGKPGTAERAPSELVETVPDSDAARGEGIGPGTY